MRSFLLPWPRDNTRALPKEVKNRILICNVFGGSHRAHNLFAKQLPLPLLSIMLRFFLALFLVFACTSGHKCIHDQLDFKPTKSFVKYDNHPFEKKHVNRRRLVCVSAALFLLTKATKDRCEPFFRIIQH